MRYWIFCGTVSIIMTLCGVILCWKGRKRRELKTTLLLLGGFVMLAVFFIRYPFLYMDSEGKYLFEKVVDTIFKSFLHTMQTISLDEEYDRFFKFPDFINNSVLFKPLLTIYTNILHFMAPVIGGAFILTILENIFPRIYIRTHPFKGKFILSELNIKSIALAEDVSENGVLDENGNIYHPLIVFTDALSCDQSLNSALAHRAKKIGAKCIEDSLSGLNLTLHSNNKPITYILIDEDEINNVSAAVELSKKFNGTKQKNVCVYVFSHQKEAEIILDSIGKKNTTDGISSNVKIRLIDEARSTIYQLLDKRPLFSDDPEFKGISLLIVGCGWMGREMVKAAAWCGQLGEKYPLKINVVDYTEQNINELKFECPELFNLQNRYDISTTVINVRTQEFEYYLKEKAEDTTHVIVVLGSDDINISTATIIRSAFSRLRLWDNQFASPAISVLIENQTKSEQIETMIDSGCNSLNIKPFGSIKERFTQDAAINSTLDELARKVHLAYCEILDAPCSSDEYKKANASFEQIMYNQRSSCAAAVHIKYKMFALGVAGLLENGITPEIIKEFAEKLKDEKNALWLMQLEHTRWNAYMRSEGFRTPNKNEFEEYFNANGKHQNLLARLHPCLVPCDASNNLCKVCVENGNIILKENPDPVEIQEAWDVLCEKNEEGLEAVDIKIDKLDRVSLRVYKLTKDLVFNKEGKKYAIDIKNDNFKVLDYEIVLNIPKILVRKTGENAHQTLK